MTPCEYDALRVKQEPPRTLPLEKLVTRTDERPPRDTTPRVNPALRMWLEKWRESRRWW